MKIKNIAAIIIYFIFSFNTFGQISKQNIEKDYMPLFEYELDSEEANSIFNKLQNRTIQHDYTKLSKAKALEKELNDDLVKTLKEWNTDGLLMYSDTITNYLNNILENIIESNPCLKGKEYEVFLRRSIVPNAANYGEGIFLFNLGLLSRFSYESQIAFVLCHELAHDYKEDVSNKIKETVLLLTDVALKKKLKTISKQEYGRMESLDQFINTIVSDRNKYSRTIEFRADSIGLEFFLNAKYNPVEASNTILLLDSLDIPFYTEKIDYNIIFSFPDYPFDESLIYVDTNDLDWHGNLDTEIPDSLKTHPACDFRAEKLTNMIPESSKDINFHNNKITYFKSIATFEKIQYLADLKYYSFALYYTLSMLTYYPENQYLKGMIVFCLNGVCDALDEHTFSKSVDMPSDQYIETYNELLRLLNNASYSELSSLKLNYYNQHVKPNMGTNQFANYIKLLFELKKCETSETEAKLIATYIDKYPKSYYSYKLKTQNH